MNKYEEKLKNLLEERETIIAEINELQKALQQREQRIIQISGSIMTLQEVIDDFNFKADEKESEETTDKE